MERDQEKYRKLFTKMAVFWDWTGEGSFFVRFFDYRDVKMYPKIQFFRIFSEFFGKKLSFSSHFSEFLSLVSFFEITSILLFAPSTFGGLCELSYHLLLLKVAKNRGNLSFCPFWA